MRNDSISSLIPSEHSPVSPEETSSTSSKSTPVPHIMSRRDFLKVVGALGAAAALGACAPQAQETYATPEQDKAAESLTPEAFLTALDTARLNLEGFIASNPDMFAPQTISALMQHPAALKDSVTRASFFIPEIDLTLLNKIHGLLHAIRDKKPDVKTGQLIEIAKETISETFGDARSVLIPVYGGVFHPLSIIKRWLNSAAADPKEPAATSAFGEDAQNFLSKFDQNHSLPAGLQKSDSSSYFDSGEGDIFIDPTQVNMIAALAMQELNTTNLTGEEYRALVETFRDKVFILVFLHEYTHSLDLAVNYQLYENLNKNSRLAALLKIRSQIATPAGIAKNIPRFATGDSTVGFKSRSTYALASGQSEDASALAFATGVYASTKMAWILGKTKTEQDSWQEMLINKTLEDNSRFFKYVAGAFGSASYSIDEIFDGSWKNKVLKHGGDENAIALVETILADDLYKLQFYDEMRAKEAISQTAPPMDLTETLYALPGLMLNESVDSAKLTPDVLGRLLVDKAALVTYNGGYKGDIDLSQLQMLYWRVKSVSSEYLAEIGTAYFYLEMYAPSKVKEFEDSLGENRAAVTYLRELAVLLGETENTALINNAIAKAAGVLSRANGFNEADAGLAPLNIAKLGAEVTARTTELLRQETIA